MRGLIAALAALPVAATVVATLVAAVVLASAASLGTPRDALACSCVAPMPLADYAAQGNVILAGQVIADDGEGVQVGVETWFAGPGAAPVARIAGDFGNGASCGVGSRPAVGSRWIWVAWRPEPENPVEGLLPGDLSISICAPFGDLATPEGQALLSEAQETFGSGVTPEPATSAEGPPPTTPEGAVLVAGVGVLVLGALVLLGAVLVARRRSSPAEPPR